MSNVYISKALRKDIPSDAVLLSKSEVLTMHWQTIKNWKPQTDTWPFRYGIGSLVATTSVTALSITQYFRRKLKIGPYGRVTMMIPTVLLPTMTATAFHLFYVTQPIILQEGECPLCIQTRAALLQVSVGVLYPIIVSPIAGFYYALGYGTYNVPPMRREYIPEIFQLWLKLSRKLTSRRLPIYLAVNGFLASALVYFETDSFYTLQRKMYEKDEEFRKSLKDRRAL